MPIEGRSIHTTSTGTTDKHLAEKIAFAFYGDCLVRSRIANGLLPAATPSRDNRFDRIADSFLDRMESEAGADARRIRNVKDYKAVVLGRGGLAAFFGKQDINSITTERIRDFLQFQIGFSRKGNLAATTQKRTLAVLSVLLKYALGSGALKSLPLMPKIKAPDNPRPWFEKDEYVRLYTDADRFSRKCRECGRHEEAETWAELSDFVVFMVHSFLRPSEWANLQHRHINLITDQVEYLEIDIIGGKTGDRRSVSMPPAVEAYRRLVARYGSRPENYLFKRNYQNRQTAKERMRDDFEKLIVKTNLAFNGFGEKRTMYSLRHTALMMRLVEGKIDILSLAKNAGTSVEMLERFYLRNLRPMDIVRSIENNNRI